MDKSHIILLSISITLGIGLVFALLLPYYLSLEDREGARPRDGITVVRSNHIDINSMVFYVVTTRDTHYIEVRMVTSPNTSNVKQGILGIYFPYNVKLDREHMKDYVNYSNWYENDNYEYGTAFVRNFPCNDEKCNLQATDQVVFYLKPEVKFDSKNIFRHSIKLKITNHVGDTSDFFEEFEDRANLNYTIDPSSIMQVTVIIPEIADTIHTLPIPEPDMFHNSGFDYSNTHLNWKITQNEHVFFADYEMPDERKDFEIQQIIVTVIGVSLGLMAIPLSIYNIKRK